MEPAPARRRVLVVEDDRPVVLTTGYAGTVPLVESPGGGAVCLVKPFNLSELAGRIDAIV